MNHSSLPSRRNFLHATLGTVALGSVSPGRHGNLFSSQLRPLTAESAIVARVKLPKDIYESGSVLEGEIYFHRPPSGAVEARWVDSAGRIAEAVNLPAPASLAAPLPFSIRLAEGLTYCNWIQVSVNGVTQIEGAKFLLSPPAAPWDDFHTIMWAGYPDGFYDLLRRVGIDATIAYRDSDFANVLDNNFKFYVEQLVWEIFAVYHKRQELWRSVVERFQAERENWKLLVRNPCLNDPKTDEYLRERIAPMVRSHRAFRPLYYTIADELGHGDQIKPVDFCHSIYCTVKLAEYLRQLYGSLDRLGAEWGGMEVTRWDDETMRSGFEWQHDDLLIARTTTDRAFDSIAVAALHVKYGSMARFNKEWGTGFPEPTTVGMTVLDEWLPVIDLVREARSLPTFDERVLESKLGPLEAANVRWGKRGGWTTEQKPTRFRNWSEVSTFLKRFYTELAEVRSSDGWNVAPWCDFRNFMDATFAASVRRAAAICKAEDPEARCATEGGQAPSAFGWYNYEQVVKSVDVIEPYNIGNNVEVIRSLNPGVICLATHGFGYSPGKALTPEDKLEQRRKIREVWWQLFHSHRGAILWDDMELNFRFINTETRQLMPSAEAFSEVFREIRGGIARLILNSRRTHDGLAIHYSHASLQIHWLLENLKHARDWMVNNVSYRGSRFIALRNSWTKLIEDLGYQYNFVSREQIEAGKLTSGEYRVFIMPQSVAVSAREAEHIREFVRSGGLLVADYRAATLNEHGRDLARGQLDDVFGIGRGPEQAAARSVLGVANQDSLRLEGTQLVGVQPGDLSLKTETGEALARSGNVPIMIVNRFGNGRTVFMNLAIADYAYQRLQADINSSLPDLLENVLSLAQLRPRVRVLGADGKRIPGTEIVVFANGTLEHVAIFRNPQFDEGGWGDNPMKKTSDWDEGIDNSFLEKPIEATVEWTSARQTYDMRRRADLGMLQAHKTTLNPWWPLLFTRSPQSLPKLGAEVAAARAGLLLELTFTNEAMLPEGAIRVVRLDFETPDGGPYDLYARNLLLTATPHTESVPLAYNDPKGPWVVRVHDLMTGQVLDVAFDVA